MRLVSAVLPAILLTACPLPGADVRRDAGVDGADAGPVDAGEPTVDAGGPTDAGTDAGVEPVDGGQDVVDAGEPPDVGGPCSTPADCATGVCARTPIGPTCLPRGCASCRPDETCRIEEDCRGSCQPPGTADDLCGNHTNASRCVEMLGCGGGLECTTIQQTPFTGSIPTAFAFCQVPAGIGEPCPRWRFTTDDGCADGLVCGDDGFGPVGDVFLTTFDVVPGRCVPPGANGTPCRTGDECTSGVCAANGSCVSGLCASDDDCQPDEVCSGTSIPCAPACVPPARAGEPCLSLPEGTATTSPTGQLTCGARRCAAGLRCADHGSDPDFGNATCDPPLPLDAPCDPPLDERFDNPCADGLRCDAVALRCVPA